MPVSAEFEAFPSDDPDAEIDNDQPAQWAYEAAKARNQRPPAYLDPADLRVEDLHTVAAVVSRWRSLRQPVG
ncbi:hypothetical protein ACFWUP_09225 [Nocardia sp. NPDC058658]|uniref:hypothetical protein n=1 Tax=Nocardia sp. NPDC058658 TaxID=3346580 RepID=UPI0036546A51